MKKKFLILIFLISILVLSGFTTTASFKDKLGSKSVLQETTETTETTEVTETTETTEVTETTEAAATTTAPTATTIPAYSRPLLNLTSFDYDYYDVYAGSVFNMATVFKNLGQQRAYNIVVTYSANSLTAEDNGGVDVISSLGADESVTSSQDFYVSTSISSSPATVNINVEYKDVNGQSYTQSFTVSVNVYGYGSYSTSTPEGRPQIVVANYETDVETLEPGTIFVLTMNLQNRGYLTAQNVSMAFGGSSGSSSSSSSTTTTSSNSSDNFLPLGTSNIDVIGDVAVQQYVQIQQSLVVDSELSPGVYPLTISFTYTDDDGNEFTDTQIITLLVYLVPSIEISFYETPDTYYIGEEDTLPIQVVNIGGDSVLLGDIYINVENAALTNNLTFIGTLESGGSFTIDTDITPQQAGTFPVTVTINYQDNFKKAQTITQTLSINVEGSGMSQMSATIDPALVATEMAKMPSTGTQTSSSIGDIILRFFRGMIGFDSSATGGQSRINQGFTN